MKEIAKIYNDYSEKFGVPRQSGIVKNLSTIVFDAKYRVKEAFNRLDEYSHVWLIWKFSLSEREEWSPTVRPPKLGGNERVGVFATRSPFRPNPIGLSCVRLVEINYSSEHGPVLIVEGADLVNGTPIFDIKPYIPYADCVTEAKSGFAVDKEQDLLPVQFEKGLLQKYPSWLLAEIEEILKQNPIPSYKKDFDRIYKMTYANKNVSFKVSNIQVTVVDIE